MRVLKVLLVILLATTSVAAQQPAPRAAGVESIDVGVVDSSGQPISGFSAGDFNVRVDGRTRRVVSAEWVTLVADPKGTVAAAPVPDGYSSNEGASGGRLIVLVIDQPGIRFGGGSAIMKAASAFINKLLPGDRVAVIGFGADAINTSFLSDFDRAKQVVARMSGQKPADAMMTYTVGLAESLQILRDELGVLDRVSTRECASQGAFQLTQCRNQVRDEAIQFAREAQQQGVGATQRLVSLFTSLKSIDPPKTVVLITEGFMVDDSEAFAINLGGLAAASRSSLYVLQLDDQLFESTAGAGRRAVGSFDDRRARVEGLEALTIAARGDLFTVSGSGATLFDRIQAESSGYYQVGLESDPHDRDGKAHPIHIEVPWKGAIVRSHRQLLNVSAPAENRSPQQTVAAGLTSPLLISTLPLRVATFALQGPEVGKLQMLIHADIGKDYSTAKRVSIGYAILDESGHPVDTRGAEGRLLPVMNGVPSALQFVGGVSVAPGDYTLKLVATEGDRVGSVEHRFQAKLRDASTVKLSELMVGGPPAGGALLVPTVGYTVSFGSVHGYLEAYRQQDEALAVRYEIANTPTSETLIAADVPGRAAGDSRVIFSRVMPVQQLPPGPYVMRAIVSLAGQPLTTLTRSFEVAAPAVLMVSADGSPSVAPDADVFLPVDEQTFTRPFASDVAVAPDVVKPFRDRVAPGARNAFDAGVASLKSGDYAKAEASFKSAVQFDAASAAAIAYMAVTYAATDHDADAVGAWQTALADLDDIPQVYDWLSQALLRTHNLPEARAILEEATEKWPTDTRFSGSLAAVYATFGKGREAVRLLERYIENSPNDADAASVGVEWLYQVHSAGGVVHSRTDDLKLAHAWAARYGSGPQEALVRQWLDFLERGSR